MTELRIFFADFETRATAIHAADGDDGRVVEMALSEMTAALLPGGGDEARRAAPAVCGQQLVGPYFLLAMLATATISLDTECQSSPGKGGSRVEKRKIGS